MIRLADEVEEYARTHPGAEIEIVWRPVDAGGGEDR
jgi:hypothetical protein